MREFPKNTDEYENVESERDKGEGGDVRNEGEDEIKISRDSAHSLDMRAEY